MPLPFSRTLTLDQSSRLTRPEKGATIRRDKRRAPSQERKVSALPGPLLFKACLANVAAIKTA